MIKTLYICDVCEKEKPSNEMHSAYIEEKTVSNKMNGGLITSFDICDECLKKVFEKVYKNRPNEVQENESIQS